MRSSTTDGPCTNHLDMRVTSRHQPAPPQATRSIAYALLAAVFAAGMLGTTLPTPLYVLYQEQYHFSSLLITVIFAMYAVGVLVSLLFVGHTSDHFGRRPVLAVALGTAVGSTLLFVFAQNVPMLLAGRILSGLAAGLITGTATAALAELQPAGNQQEAARVATAANLGGLGLGPLVAGLFAQFAPAPTRLVFGVYLAVLAGALLATAMLVETVQAPDHVLDLRPRLGVPPSAHAVYVPAAVTVFCVFTLLGLFTALVPSFLRSTLHEPNLALAGFIVFLLFGAAAASQLVLHALTSRRARLMGLVLLLLALALIELGLVLPSLPLFLVGTVAGGVGIGLAFMGSLAAINQVAPPGRRAELVSSFFVAAYLGITLPVVGVGLLAQLTNLLVASICLAAVIALLLLATLTALLRPGHGSEMRAAGA
jgi:MFS family permease